ncbi:MAG: hypothetical protein QOE45_571 [Frankiaceae bacterium]|jgi:hypothetical protein|nr:hypothetical protein [Frankiaceae bacterium]
MIRTLALGLVFAGLAAGTAHAGPPDLCFWLHDDREPVICLPNGGGGGGWG